MATALPAKLRIPSIQPFATRAAQLSKIRPIIAYWCNYHIVNQILARGLHSADDECRDFTTDLMDKLETAKNQTPPVDAIVDDIAAKAYVEQFALETFQRGDDAIHTDKASRQTIDTFQAATTFIELLTTWEPLSAELQAKVKYAKYHALRIAKAIKAGEDPNATNPKDEIAPPPAAGLEDLASPTGAPDAALAGSNYQPPSVESVPDSAMPSRPASALDSHAVPPSTTNEGAIPSPETPREPPLASVSQDQAAGSEYFPAIPTAAPPSLTTPAIAPPPPATPGITSSTTATPDPSTFYTDPSLSTPATGAQPPAQLSARGAVSPAPPPAPALAAAIPATLPTTAPVARYIDDDEAVAKAQKHARWAISALNFEDVPTAVKELRLALQTLGTQ